MSPSAGTNSSQLFLSSQQFSDNIFLTTLAVRVPQSVCMYTVNLLDSLVFPLIAAVTQWPGILFIFLACIGTCSDCGTMYSNYLYIVSD